MPTTLAWVFVVVVFFVGAILLYRFERKDQELCERRMWAIKTYREGLREIERTMLSRGNL